MLANLSGLRDDRSFNPNGNINGSRTALQPLTPQPQEKGVVACHNQLPIRMKGAQ
jgi:hypothetical protein